MTQTVRSVVIAAGGTGGHLFPAQALAESLLRRRWRVELATDTRVTSYGQDFPASAVHVLPSATISGRHPFSAAAAILTLGQGFFKSLQLIRRTRPMAAVGFGGYPTVSPMLAAAMLGVPTIVHEANAVPGRANRFLAAWVDCVAANTAALSLPVTQQRKLVVTGNPVRPSVIEAAKLAYPKRARDDPFNLLVFGGSQGASVFADIVPQALARLGATEQARIRLTQQCRPADVERVRASYEALGLECEVAPFFRDLPRRIAESHLVISRSGASTVSELGVIGRPAILVPLPGAIDQDQKANAAAMVALGGAIMIEQAGLSAERLAEELTAAMDDPDRFARAAAAARGFGKVDAAERLADLVEQLAATRDIWAKKSTSRKGHESSGASLRVAEVAP